MGIFTPALLATTGFGVSKSMKSNITFTDLALSNVEALAQNEGVDEGGGGCRWATRETWQGWEAVCIDTGVGYDCSCGKVKSGY